MTYTVVRGTLNLNKHQTGADFEVENIQEPVL